VCVAPASKCVKTPHSSLCPPPPHRALPPARERERVVCVSEESVPNSNQCTETHRCPCHRTTTDFCALYEIYAHRCAIAEMCALLPFLNLCWLACLDAQAKKSRSTAPAAATNQQGAHPTLLLDTHCRCSTSTQVRNTHGIAQPLPITRSSALCRAQLNYV
jgi:hypothetical protein